MKANTCAKGEAGIRSMSMSRQTNVFEKLS